MGSARLPYFASRTPDSYENTSDAKSTASISASYDGGDNWILVPSLLTESATERLFLDYLDNETTTKRELDATWLRDLKIGEVQQFFILDD